MPGCQASSCLVTPVFVIPGQAFDSRPLKDGILFRPALIVRIRKVVPDELVVLKLRRKLFLLIGRILLPLLLRLPCVHCIPVCTACIFPEELLDIRREMEVREDGCEECPDLLAATVVLRYDRIQAELRIHLAFSRWQSLAGRRLRPFPCLQKYGNPFCNVMLGPCSAQPIIPTERLQPVIVFEFFNV